MRTRASSSWPERVTVALLMVIVAMVVWLITGSLVLGLVCVLVVNFLDRG